MAARLTTKQVWHQVAKGSFAVLSYVTPAGEPRSSGVLYKTIGRRLYIAVAPDSWKARHVAASGRVAVTVPVRRGGLLSVVAPIPPATISFHATAIVHPADSPQVRSVLKELASLLPAERRASRLHHRGHPRGPLRDLRRRRFLDAAARPGSRSRPRAGDPRKERTMKIEYFHASKFGNGAMVAEEFNKQMAAKGVTVDVHHIREARPDRLPTADLYVFSSPGRMGKPIGGMRRFLKKLRLPAGTRYAILTTEMAPQPDKKTGQIPTEEEQARWQRVRPIMNELLQGAGLVKVAEDKVLVTGLKGPLEEGWQQKVAAFAARIPLKCRAPTTVRSRRVPSRPPDDSGRPGTAWLWPDPIAGPSAMSV